MPGLRDPWHWVVLVIVIVVVFGWKKLPDASRSLARSLRIFKNELTSGNEDAPRGPVSGEVVDPAPRSTAAPDAPTGAEQTRTQATERPADGDR